MHVCVCVCVRVGVGVVCRAKSDSWSWEHQALLLQQDAVAPMRSFLLRMMADKTIPLPGDVHVMTGGPPCQVRTGETCAYGLTLYVDTFCSVFLCP